MVQVSLLFWNLHDYFHIYTHNKVQPNIRLPLEQVAGLKILYCFYFLVLGNSIIKELRNIWKINLIFMKIAIYKKLNSLFRWIPWLGLKIICTFISQSKFEKEQCYIHLFRYNKCPKSNSIKPSVMIKFHKVTRFCV